MRNLWAIMKEFNTLPTDERFKELSHDQIDLIGYSMMEDHRLMELARKGLAIDSEHYDSDFDDEVWNREAGDWDVLKPGHDADKIAQQIADATKAEDLKNLASKFDSLDDYNAHLEAGGKTAREMEVSDYIDQQLANAYEKAQRIARAGGKHLVDDAYLAGETEEVNSLDKAAMDKSIALFNQQDEDDEYTEL
ncbi:hypothetical protein BCU4_0196 [Bacillus phage BCU4]|uniref:Tail assembly chaperone n=1 Tax=Bacillus phage BCU4 TaxID=1126951 RepID=J9PR31_9CAUD|nr:hypothetical protein QLX27_gp196 [Bacillus phage BCU4]AEW47702.1 hypothetical protein BCU4_0196 [Bacillus phage BCU4]